MRKIAFIHFIKESFLLMFAFFYRDLTVIWLHRATLFGEMGTPIIHRQDLDLI